MEWMIILSSFVMSSLYGFPLLLVLANITFVSVLIM